MCYYRRVEIEQSYAHFHRVLSEMLEQLIKEGETLWLGKEGHTFRPDYEKNTYNKAIYIVSGLGPYRDALHQLEQLQKQVMLETGVSKPYTGILLPKVLTGVTRIRLNTRINWVSERLDKGRTLSRLRKIHKAAQKNLDEFAKHRYLFDPVFDKVEADVKEVKRVLELVRSEPEQEYRYRTCQEFRNPYIYQGQQAASAYVLNHGLIAVGRQVVVERQPAYRRERQDKVQAPLLFENRFNRLYREDDWQRAKDAQQSKTPYE
jgi:hypothetical protein